MRTVLPTVARASLVMAASAAIGAGLALAMSSWIAQHDSPPPAATIHGQRPVAVSDPLPSACTGREHD